LKLREKTAPTFDGHLAHVGAWFDERVMRMGFGELAAVKTLRESGIKVSTVPGWRTGLLIVDDEFYLFTPTALYLEAEPKGLVESNGVRLAPGYVKARRCAPLLF